MSESSEKIPKPDEGSSEKTQPSPPASGANASASPAEVKDPDTADTAQTDSAAAELPTKPAEASEPDTAQTDSAADEATATPEAEPEPDKEPSNRQQPNLPISQAPTESSAESTPASPNQQVAPDSPNATEEVQAANAVPDNSENSPQSERTADHEMTATDDVTPQQPASTDTEPTEATPSKPSIQQLSLELAQQFAEAGEKVEIQGTVLHRQPLQVAGLYAFGIAICTFLSLIWPTAGWCLAAIILLSSWVQIAGGNGWFSGFLLKNSSANTLIWRSTRLPNAPAPSTDIKTLIVSLPLGDEVQTKFSHAFVLFAGLAAPACGLVSTFGANALVWFLLCLLVLFGCYTFTLETTPTSKNQNSVELANQLLTWWKEADLPHLQLVICFGEPGFHGESLAVMLENYRRFLPRAHIIQLQFDDGPTHLYSSHGLLRKKSSEWGSAIESIATTSGISPALAAQYNGWSIITLKGNFSADSEFTQLTSLVKHLNTPENA